MVDYKSIEMDIFKCFVDSPSPLSIVTIAKRLGIKRADVLKYCSKTSYIERVSPLEVGSQKEKLNVFKYVGDR